MLKIILLIIIAIIAFYLLFPIFELACIFVWKFIKLTVSIIKDYISESGCGCSGCGCLIVIIIIIIAFRIFL